MKPKLFKYRIDLTLIKFTKKNGRRYWQYYDSKNRHNY